MQYNSKKIKNFTNIAIINTFGKIIKDFTYSS